MSGNLSFTFDCSIIWGKIVKYIGQPDNSTRHFNYKRTTALRTVKITLFKFGQMKNRVLLVSWFLRKPKTESTTF
jgi:hypothetical protein